MTAIAFNLAVSARLPSVGYLTTLDKMIIWSIILVFLSIFEALSTGRMVDGDDQYRDGGHSH